MHWQQAYVAFFFSRCVVLLHLVLQLFCMDLQSLKSESVAINTNCSQFLSEPIILKIVIAIFVSTTAMATLEPCLPIWLMETSKPEVQHISRCHSSSSYIFNILFKRHSFFRIEVAVWNDFYTRFVRILCEHKLFRYACSSYWLHASGYCIVISCWHCLYLGKANDKDTEPLLFSLDISCIKFPYPFRSHSRTQYLLSYCRNLRSVWALVQSMLH